MRFYEFTTKPIHLSARTSVWRVSTIMNWANEREANKY